MLVFDLVILVIVVFRFEFIYYLFDGYYCGNILCLLFSMMYVV